MPANSLRGETSRLLFIKYAACASCALPLAPCGTCCQVLLRARAIETQSFVLAAAQVNSRPRGAFAFITALYFDLIR